MVRSGGGGQTAVSHLGQDLSWSRQATESERERRERAARVERERRERAKSSGDRAFGCHSAGPCTSAIPCHHAPCATDAQSRTHTTVMIVSAQVICDSNARHGEEVLQLHLSFL